MVRARGFHVTGLRDSAACGIEQFRGIEGLNLETMSGRLCANDYVSTCHEYSSVAPQCRRMSCPVKWSYLRLVRMILSPGQTAPNSKAQFYGSRQIASSNPVHQSQARCRYSATLQCAPCARFPGCPFVKRSRCLDRRFPRCRGTGASYEGGTETCTVPPRTSTLPSWSSVAVWPERANCMLPVDEKVSVAGSNSSAVERDSVEPSYRHRPITSTLPSLSNVAV